MMIKTFCITFCCTILVSGNYGSLRGDKLDFNSGEDVLQGVLKRLNSLESKYQRQADDNAELRKTLKDLEAQISSLKNENQKFRNQINALQTNDQRLDTAVKDLQDRGSNRVKGNQRRGHDGKEHFKAISEVKIAEGKDKAISTDDTEGTASQPLPGYSKPQNRSEGSMRRSPRTYDSDENDVNVAFFATIHSHHLEHLGVNQAVVFNHVITNVGNAYNHHTGDFRAPVAGTYVFSVTLMALGTGTVHCQIVKNGHGIANVYVYGAEPRDETSSMTAVLELQQGEDVIIRNLLSDVTIHGYGYTYFSGFLLFQAHSSPAIVGK